MSFDIQFIKNQLTSLFDISELKNFQSKRKVGNTLTLHSNQKFINIKRSIANSNIILKDGYLILLEDLQHLTGKFRDKLPCYNDFTKFNASFSYYSKCVPSNVFLAKSFIYIPFNGTIEDIRYFFIFDLGYCFYHISNIQELQDTPVVFKQHKSFESLRFGSFGNTGYNLKGIQEFFKKEYIKRSKNKSFAEDEFTILCMQFI